MNQTLGGFQIRSVLYVAIIFFFVCGGVVALIVSFGRQEAWASNDKANQAAAIALILGAVLFVAAATAALLRQTRNVPTARRLRLMAHIAYIGVLNVLPSRRAMAAPAGALLAFLGALLVGLTATVIIVRLIPPEVPNPTEAYEGIGDFVRAVFFLGIGALASLIAALFVGIAIGLRIAKRQEIDARAH
jgi:hypothetical protein